MFWIKGHATMAANESIVDPLVFLKKYLVFPFSGMGVL